MDEPQKKKLDGEISAACSGDRAERLRFRGQEAQARRRDKRRAILGWLQRFGSTDVSIVARLLGASRSAAYKTMQQLASEKLIQPVPVDGCLATIYILTENGLAEAEVHGGSRTNCEDDGYDWLGVWAPVPVYPSRLAISHLQHDHLVQHVALDLIERRQALADQAKKAFFMVGSYGFSIDEEGFDYVPSRTIQRATPANVGVKTKVPDLVFGLNLNEGFPGAIIAVEVQQTYQRGDEASVDLSRYAQEIGGRNTRLFKVIYASTRPTVLAYYKARMTPELGFWAAKLNGLGYFKDETKPSPATPEIIERFEFRDISKLHKIYYPGA